MSNVLEDALEANRPLVVLQAHLKAVDQSVRLTNLTNKEQIAVCALACAMAFQRLMEAGDATGQPFTRAQRRLLVKSVIEDFETKLKRYGAGDETL